MPDSSDPDMQAVLQASAPATAQVSGGPDPDMQAVLSQNNGPASTWDEIKSNVVDPLARAGAKAVWALPGMAMDLGVASRNLIEGKNKEGQYPYELPSTTFNKALDAYLPPPSNPLTKGSELANTLILGGALPTPSSIPAASDAASGLTAAQQSAAQKGVALGMKMTPGQETGSRVAQQMEARMQSIPAFSGPFGSLLSHNQEVLNTQAAKAIGEPGSAVDSNALESASDRLGQIFESVRNPNNIVVLHPDTTKAIISDIDEKVSGLLPGNASIKDNPLVKNLLSASDKGAATGEQLGTLSSKLGKVAFKQMTSLGGDRDLGIALYDVKSHVDDLLQSSLSPTEQAAYSQARQQYRTLMQLTSRTGIVNPSSGNVSGAMLANKLQQSDKSGYLLGGNQSPLYNAARFAQAFKPIVGDSGTATRSMSLKDMALSVPGNIASWLYLHPGAPAVRALLNTPGSVRDALINGANPQTLGKLGNYSAILNGAGDENNQ